MTWNPGRQFLESGATLVIALLLALTAEAWGQNPLPARVPVVPNLRVVDGPPNVPAEEDLAENVFLPADRRTLQKLADSRKLLAEGRFSEAVRALGDILEEPEDFFFQPDRNAPIHRSLKNEAQRFIGQMPREGRELYELQYGARARHLLEEALESGAPAALAEVSRRFFHTRAGYQATFLLGLDHFDHGRWLAGALTLQRLREAGASIEELEPGLSLTLAACWLQADMPEKARQCLVALRLRHPTLRVTVAGRKVPIFTDDAAAIEWLVGLIGPHAVGSGGGKPASAEAERWWMFRGNAARNASSIGGMPLLNIRWRVPAADDPLTEDALDQFKRQYIEEGLPMIPALHPLAVGDVLLMRTVRNLLAVDFTSGKRLWETPTEENDDAPSRAENPELQMRQAMQYGGLAQRVSSDTTYGAISSDGQRVFAIEDLELSYGTAGTMVFRLGRAMARNPRVIGGINGDQDSLFNRLAAYDIRTGKLAWNIGGPAGQHALRQSETYFLGAPLPLMGQLYVLGEVQGEIRLIVLDAASGDLLWSQQLAIVEQGVAQDPLRRSAGISPSYADGILVCPTSTGAIVGVELATRSLLWGYRYGQDRNRRRSNRMIMPSVAQGQPAPSRWIDGIVSIADGRVLATPVESESLYCLSLIEGKELWRANRQDDLYVGCADREKVVLVGRHAVRALRMSDGKPAWDGRIMELPDEAVPSGIGFHAGDRYFLPLSTAEVIAIDLGTGNIVQRTKSRNRLVPGNLVCYRNLLISQGFEGVEAYYRLDAVRRELERRLAADPNDAEALSLQGEIFLEAGNRSEAIASFRRAYQSHPDQRTRQLLRDTLLEGLRLEFAAYRDFGVEVEHLLEDSADQVVYLRLMADGLRHEGRWTPSLDYYQRVIDLDPDRRPLDRMDENLSARRDRWVQGRLTVLRNEAKDDAAAKLDAVVQSRLQDAMADGSIERLQRFFDYFGDQPPAAAARMELVRRLRDAGRLLEAELTASDEDVSKEQPKSDEESWPVGKVEASSRATKNMSSNGYARHVIEMRGDPGPYDSDSTIHFDGGRRLLVANDGWGRQQWQFSLASDDQNQNFIMNRAWSYAKVEKHLLLVVLGWKIMALDTLRSGKSNAPQLLWTHDLMSSSLDPSEMQAAIPWPMPNMPMQWQQRLGHVSDRSSLLGPLTRRYLCCQRLRNFIAVDPHSGETLWAREDVPPGSDVFGDDEYVFVLTPEQQDAMLLRAIDGELLGTRKIPRPSSRQRVTSGEQKTVYARLEEYCLGTFGRRLLLWWPKDNQRELTLIDPFDGRDVWPSRLFPNNAHTSVAADKAVGIMQSDGKFVLISLPDGRTLADLKLEAERTLIDITLLANGGKYFLLTRSSPSRGHAPTPMSQTPGCDPSKPIYQGRLYAIDEQGKLLWPRPAIIENQFMLLDQPARLPLLSFACQTHEQNADDGNLRQILSLMMIDKRNGRVAYKGALPSNMGVLGISGDAEKKTVDLATQRETIRLTFTDQPLLPPTDDEYQPVKLPKQSSSKLHGIWRSVERMLERALDDLGQQPPLPPGKN